MKIVAISGSLRGASLNTALLRAAIQRAPDHMTITLCDISELPLYNAELDGDVKPESAVRLAEAVRAADGVLLATPEYNFSVSAPMKNAIDWISRFDPQPLERKPVGLMGAAGGGLGTARAQYHLRQILVYLDAITMNKPELFVGGARHKFNDGALIDEELSGSLVRYLEAFDKWVKNVGRMSA